MALKHVVIRTTLTGVTELKMHNIQLADPDNEWTRKIARLTSKRKMTEEDRQEKGRLEFLGGLYTHDNHVIMPQTNLKRCYKEGAKATRLGRHIDRALHPADPKVYLEGLPLEFPDSHLAPAELWKMPEYHDRTMVAAPGRVQRTRPKFSQWSVTADWMLYFSLLSVEDFRSVAEYAGLIEGLGDNRVNGDGRFTITVEEIS